MMFYRISQENTIFIIYWMQLIMSIEQVGNYFYLSEYLSKNETIEFDYIVTKQ